MKLSIIIASWNTKQLLRDCLQSIKFNSPDCSFEVIVVDNASHDSSAEMVAQEFSDTVLLKNSLNRGYAGGNNDGFRVSCGEYVLLLGSDTEVFPGTIQRLADYLDSHPDVGIVACRLELPQGGLQRSCKRFPTVLNAMALYCSLNFLNNRYFMSDFDHTSEQEIDQPDATCILIRRSALEGYIFDERFSILYNDVDLCQRVKRKGWRIMFLPQSKVVHHGSQSTKQADPSVRLVMYQNILLYYQSYFGLYARMLLTPILIIRFMITTKSLNGISLLYSLHRAKLS